MSNSQVKTGTFGLLRIVLLMLWIGQSIVAVQAQTEAQGLPVSAPKRIVLLYSYGDGIPAYQQVTRAFMSVMQEARVSFNNLFFEYLDLERKNDIEHYKNLTTLLRHKYASEKIDLIITVHTQALRFILNEGKELFPEVPVLSYLAPTTIETAGSQRQFLLLPMKMDFRGTLELAQQLFPQVNRVVFINGVGKGEERLEREAKSVFSQWHNKLEFEYTSDLSLEEILQRIATLPPRTIAFYSNVFRDKTGRTFIPKDVAGKVAKAANAPVFGMYNTILGSGIIGGSMFNFEEEGARAATLALDILRGNLALEKPLTVFEASRTPMFDWEQLKRWGVKENRLPPGSIVLNRPKTLWSEYKGLVILGIAVFLTQTMLVIGLLVQKTRRRSAEESLAKAEAKYRNIFDSALEGIFETSAEGQFLTANRALAKMLGYDSPEELISLIKDTANQVWADPNGRADYLRLLDEQNVILGFECKFLRKDGTKFWVSLNTRRVTGPDGQTLLYSGFLEDITARKQAEEALKERLNFEMLMAEISALFVNLPAERIDSEIEAAQRRVCEFLELDRSSLFQADEKDPETLVLTHVYQPPGSRIPPERMSLKGLFPWVLPKVLGGETITISKMTDLPAEAGRDREAFGLYDTRSVVAAPLAVGRRGVFGLLTFAVMREEREWTETVVEDFQLIAQVFANALARKSAEASLRQKTEELDQFFGLTLDLLCIADTEGYFLRLNPAWERVLGYSREELTARRFLDFVHPDDSAATEEAISRLASQRDVIYLENRYRCEDGSYRWLEWTASPAGELIYAAARDITERLKAETDARQRMEELAHVARIATMGELTTSLAHEINQPLAAIRSNAEAAQRFLSGAAPDIDEVRQILEDIIRDDMRADDVVRKVRALVRKEKSREEILDLNRTIKELIGLIRGEFLLQGLSFTMELGPDLKMIRGDRVQLQQVILNLILNSAAAMRNSPRAQRKIIVRTAMPDSGTVKASVTDFGTGIDENNIERLFEPFYTTKPEGLGMGLSICERIITAHGGTLKAENNPQGGATFAFTLPAHQGEAP